MLLFSPDFLKGQKEDKQPKNKKLDSCKLDEPHVDEETSTLREGRNSSASAVYAAAKAYKSARAAYGAAAAARADRTSPRKFLGSTTRAHTGPSGDSERTCVEAFERPSAEAALQFAASLVLDSAQTNRFKAPRCDT